MKWPRESRIEVFYKFSFTRSSFLEQDDRCIEGTQGAIGVGEAFEMDLQNLVEKWFGDQAYVEHTVVRNEKEILEDES